MTARDGQPQGYSTSRFYEMERQQVAGYRNYVGNVQ